ncbi:hypothetical protein ACKWTF_001923 [Chironomus riparius]
MTSSSLRTAVNCSYQNKNFWDFSKIYHGSFHCFLKKLIVSKELLTFKHQFYQKSYKLSSMNHTKSSTIQSNQSGSSSDSCIHIKGISNSVETMNCIITAPTINREYIWLKCQRHVDVASDIEHEDIPRIRKKALEGEDPDLDHCQEIKDRDLVVLEKYQN